MGKDWRLRRQIEDCYTQRGKRRPTPAEDDLRTRRAWDVDLGTNANPVDMTTTDDNGGNSKSKWPWDKD